MIWRTFIPGVPKPQGSKTSGRRRDGGTYLREDNPGAKPWRKEMVRALQCDDGSPVARFDSAVWVRIRFVFLRPKSHKPDSLPTSKLLGDVDKLTRNVLDALTQAGVITDDKFVIKLRDVEKVYGPNPGVHIEVGPAVPNPFGDGIAAPIEFAAPAAAVESWEPTAASLILNELKARDRDEFWQQAWGKSVGPVGAPCSCQDRCRGYDVCKLLRAE